MLLLYSAGIRSYHFIIWILSFFNAKARHFTEGRKNILKRISNQLHPGDVHIWFHFASLGEFEQGRPVLEKLKARFPQKKIIITFFSPSGYEIRKNYALAEAVFYLPIDTAYQAKKFIEMVKPEMAIFTKYEFWHNYFKVLHQKQIPLYIISGIFRKNQVFFKSYGAFYRKTLSYVTHFFVQNEESKTLLKGIGLQNVTLSGDTRFDRVYENAQAPKQLEAIEHYIGYSATIICGSTWPEDEKILAALSTKFPDWKFIIAPHEVNPAHIHEIETLFEGKAQRFSRLNTGNPQKSQILIIDNIGMLSALYQYGRLAYIGGGFGAGIHNTLEAAAFGLPVIFGPKYDKFQEAKDLIETGAAKSINDVATLLTAFNEFKNNKQAAVTAAEYVSRQKGATLAILRYLYPEKF